MSKPEINYKKHGDLTTVEPIVPAYHRSFKTKLDFNEEDTQVATHIGSYLHSLYAQDIKACLASGTRKDRKRELTVFTSSRWAGSITNAAQTQVNLTRRTSKMVREEKQAELRILKAQHKQEKEKAKKNDSSVSPKREAWFQAEKSRLQLVIQAHRDYYKNQNYPITLGGKKLFKEVVNGKVGAIERWHEKRLFLQADGESKASCGNNTIQINRHGYLVITIPRALRGEYGDATHYTFSQPVILHQGKALIEAHIEHDLAVSYTITCLTGQWSLTSALDVNRQKVRDLGIDLLGTIYQHHSVPQQKSCEEIEAHSHTLPDGKYALGVDMNANHLACHRIDQYGNPVGSSVRFDYKTDVSTTHTEAQILHALDQLFHYCDRTKVGLIVLEDLKGFSGSKSKTTNSKGAAFRKIVSGMPVSKIRQRIFDRAAIRGIRVCMVNPAYTSKLGVYYWSRNNQGKVLDRHSSASIVIGRRGLGYRAHRNIRGQGTTPEDVVPVVSDVDSDNGSVAAGTLPPVLETQTSQESLLEVNGVVLGDSVLE